jgi:hypothetical protein
MNLPHHLLRLTLSGDQPAREDVRVVRPTDALRNAPIFRAPALPTPHQFNGELPFTVNFRPRLRRSA